MPFLSVSAACSSIPSEMGKDACVPLRGEGCCRRHRGCRPHVAHCSPCGAVDRWHPCGRAAPMQGACAQLCSPCGGCCAGERSIKAMVLYGGEEEEEEVGRAWEWELCQGGEMVRVPLEVAAELVAMVGVVVALLSLAVHGVSVDGAAAATAAVEGVEDMPGPPLLAAARTALRQATGVPLVPPAIQAVEEEAVEDSPEPLPVAAEGAETHLAAVGAALEGHWFAAREARGRTVEDEAAAGALLRPPGTHPAAGADKAAAAAAAVVPRGL
mmetsp:Transcript_18249/g.51104  ORF Transcript_18249/g.51104 Transcript_18249/m.51104 type:complete len:270 (+) Transcript_18249:651-1460(+)